MNENIDLFKSQLDSISADIKNIQASLKDANVPFEIRHFCKKEASIGRFGGFEAFGFGPEGLKPQNISFGMYIRTMEINLIGICYTRRLNKR